MGEQGQGFTDWVMVMSQEQEDGYVCRADNHVGFYNESWADSRQVRDVVGQCGIYEFKLREGGFNNDVVYVGSTCRSRQKNSLRERVRDYLVRGSHKAELINGALGRGAEIHVRLKPCCCPGAGNDLDQLKRNAERLENDLLDRYDYAWNTRRNGEIRHI